MMLGGCSTTYTVVSIPDKYLQDTTYPTKVPATFGECVSEAIPAWKAALDAANADKEAARTYKKEVNNG